MVCPQNGTANPEGLRNPISQIRFDQKRVQYSYRSVHFLFRTVKREETKGPPCAASRYRRPTREPATVTRFFFHLSKRGGKQKKCVVLPGTALQQTTNNEAASAFHVQQGVNHFVTAGPMSLTLLELPLTLGDRCSRTMEGIKMTKVIVEESAKNFIRVEERSASPIPPQSHTRPAKINSQAQYTKHRAVSVCSPIEEVDGSVGRQQREKRNVGQLSVDIDHCWRCCCCCGCFWLPRDQPKSSRSVGRTPPGRFSLVRLPCERWAGTSGSTRNGVTDRGGP